MATANDSRNAALVTGGSRGIGHELAKLCARDGYDLVLVARRHERLRRVADELESRWGIRAMTLSKDLTRPESATEIFDAVERNDVHVDVLMNVAAGGPASTRFDETDLESTRELLRTNVLTLTSLTRLFVAPMVERGAGRILNVSSVAGELPAPAFGVYAASKGYVSTLSNVLARQLGPVGITVTVLIPGWTDTDMAERVFRARGIDPETRETMRPEEVARAGYDGLLNGRTQVIPGRRYREAIQDALSSRASNIDA